MSDTKHTPGLPLYEAGSIDWLLEWHGYHMGHLTQRPAGPDPCVTPELLAACEFLMARCQHEGLDVVNGAYETGFQHAHQTIAKANQKPT